MKTNKIAQCCMLLLMCFFSCTVKVRNDISTGNNNISIYEVLAIANTYLRTYEIAQLTYYMEYGTIGKVDDILFVQPKESGSIQYYEISQGKYCAELITNIGDCIAGSKLFVQVDESANVSYKTNNRCISKMLPKYVFEK